MTHTTIVMKQENPAKMKPSKHQMLIFKSLTVLNFKTMEQIEITL